MKSIRLLTFWLNPFFACIVTLASITSPSLAEDGPLFPDKKLEAVVRKYVFEKRNNQEPLTEKDVEDISSIEGKGQGITNLSGLEKCYSLHLIDLENNQVSDLTTIQNLQKLQSVNFANNQIQDISPLAKLSNLQYLHLAHNQIQDLKPLSELTNMRSLYLSGNQIQDISPLSSLSKVWTLYLDGNQLQDLGTLAKLSWLSSLDLRANQISDLGPLSKLTELKYVRLDDNKVSDLSVFLEMVKQDAAGKQRFAPFLRIYLAGNPLSDQARTQIDELRQHVSKVVVEPTP